MNPLAWLLLGGVGVGLAVAASGSDSSTSSSSSSSSTTTTGGGTFTTQPPEHTTATLPSTIEMTCDEALATLPGVLQPSVEAALLTGSVASAINALADQMDSLGDKLAALPSQTADTLKSEAAFHIIAHCLRARALKVAGGLSPATSQISLPAFAA